MSVVMLSISFAVSVPVIFLFVVRKFNGYLKNAVVDVESLGKKTPTVPFLLKPSPIEKIKVWLGNFRNDLNLYEKNILTIGMGVVAYLVAAQINPALVNSGVFSREQVIRVVGPLIEETLKAGILIYLVLNEDYPISVGMLYGFGTGIGFAMVENIEYILPRENIAFTVAYSRVFSTNLVHATCSGLIGAALAYMKFYRTRSDHLTAAFISMAGIALHMVFNTMVNSGVFLIVALAIGISGGGLILFLSRQANKKFGSDAFVYVNEATARTSRNEASIIKDEEDLRKVFKDVEAKYSRTQAVLVDEFLKTQVEILAKRKILKVARYSQEIDRLEKDIKELVARTDIVRKKVGWECMLYVRKQYAVDEKLWTNINDKVVAASTGQKGGGVWDTMTLKIKQSKPGERKDS